MLGEFRDDFRADFFRLEATFSAGGSGIARTLMPSSGRVFLVEGTEEDSASKSSFFGLPCSLPRIGITLMPSSSSSVSDFAGLRGLTRRGVDGSRLVSSSESITES